MCIATGANVHREYVKAALADDLGGMVGRMTVPNVPGLPDSNVH
jgi:hypothetical protein